jgi:hypothetical protein
MKYVLMMHAPGGRYQIFDWPKKALEAHIEFMTNLNARLRSANELVTVIALEGPDQAKLVRAGKNKQPVTDGVFPEAKEFLAGYWIVEVASAERAYEIAAEASTAPGRDGEPLNMNLEVRKVISSPD